MEEMTAAIRQNADNAKATEQIALKTAQDAQDGGEAVAKTVTAMSRMRRPSSPPDSTRTMRPRCPMRI